MNRGYQKMRSIDEDSDKARCKVIKIRKLISLVRKRRCSGFTDNGVCEGNVYRELVRLFPICNGLIDTLSVRL